MSDWYTPDFARYYQRDAADAAMRGWQSGSKANLIVLPTGTGKSITLGTITRRVVEQLGCRVACLTHVKELVQQDADAMLRVWPDMGMRLGINSAGLSRRDRNADALVCSVQSIQRDPTQIGERHVLIIDEAQLISRKSNSMYGKVISSLRQLNPGMCIVGLTATPYRLDSGMLTETYKEEEALFDDIAYEMGIKRAIEEAWLAPVTTRATKQRLDVSGVHRRGGEFVAGELEKAVNTDALNTTIMDEIVEQLKDGRNMALVCASGKDHAHALAKVAKDRHNLEVGVLLGDTPDSDRDAMVKRGRGGDLKMMIGVNAILVGLDIPIIDIVAAVRPTESKGLWVQAIGRGTRPVWTPGMPVDSLEDRVASMQAGPKAKGLLVLDFAGNTNRHGPIDMIDGSKAGGEGKAPVKECPECAAVVFAGLRKCPHCGHEFPFVPLNKIQGSASTAAIISSDEPPAWYYVDSMTARRHTKIGDGGIERHSLRVDYNCGAISVSKWVPLESDNEYARRGSEAWWARHSRMDDRNTGIRSSSCPTTVPEALERIRTGELRTPGRILCKREGKYWRVVQEDFSIEAAAA